MRAPQALLCLALAACTQFPELDDSITPEVASAEFPALVPLASLPAGAAAANPAAIAEELEARAAALRARGRALRRRAAAGAG